MHTPVEIKTWGSNGPTDIVTYWLHLQFIHWPIDGLARWSFKGETKGTESSLHWTVWRGNSHWPETGSIGVVAGEGSRFSVWRTSIPNKSMMHAWCLYHVQLHAHTHTLAQTHTSMHARSSSFFSLLLTCCSKHTQALTCTHTPNWPARQQINAYIHPLTWAYEKPRPCPQLW